MHSRFSPCQRQIAVATNWLAHAVFLGGSVLLAAIVIGSQGLEAQEQVDVLDRAKRAAAAIADLSLRVRVTRVAPAADSLLIDWRRGGEGLGGTVTRGTFTPPSDAQAEPNIDTKLAAPPSRAFRIGQWSAWVPVEQVCGRAKGFEFPSVTVSYPPQGRKQLDPPESMAVEFEFAQRGEPFRRFVETAPRGATVGFAFPAGLLDERGAKTPGFSDALQGLSGHARARRERLERRFAVPPPPLEYFRLIGHLGGYGQGPGSGLGKAVGFGVRHNNPEIVAEECRVLSLLGVNGLVDEKSIRMAELAGVAAGFRKIYWGGPGSGSPMAAVSTANGGEPDGCPFDPRLKQTMAEAIEKAIAQHQASGADEKWALWWDEIGVAAKSHTQDCPRCRDQFRDYLKRHGVAPADVGASDANAIAVYPLWNVEPAGAGKPPKQSLVPPPSNAADRLRYYYSYRFMSHITGQLFPDSARRLEQVGIRLYAMQGPTPSWNGSSLDWHEFYDTGANTALVFETSNRDPRSWQWESYLSDIMRGIAQRHGGLPIGCLVKPHRGAPSQRLLSVVTRGTRAIEWYTYGPDYSKGDSFSQSPELIEEVAEAGRFLAEAEPYLAQAQWLAEPQVAFVFPRSSEIWGRVGPLGATTLENAKWVYLALRHAHIPVNIYSEQQLAEGLPATIKALYVVGPNLRRDASEKVAAWVRAGGVLWTDAEGLARDEADEPNRALRPLLGAERRELEVWGKCPEYRATRLEPFSEPSPPTFATLSLAAAAGPSATAEPSPAAEPRASLAREQLVDDGRSERLATFADGSLAAVGRSAGRGHVTQLGIWAGLSYSARVRRADFDMRADFSPTLRALIVNAALRAGVNPPAVPADPLVEAVALKNTKGQSIALINWAYASDRSGPRGERLQPIADLRVRLPAGLKATSVRSIRLGVDLPVVKGEVVVPRLEKVDVLAWR
jgi:hypothetical protein